MSVVRSKVGVIAVAVLVAVTPSIGASQSSEAKVCENYDFIPGSKVLFYTDFSEDRVGNFARGLKYVSGTAEIVERDGVKMLRATARSQAVTACGCPDVFELINRLNMAEAAISALNAQLSQFEALDRSTGKASSMEDRHGSGMTNQDHLRQVINGAMSDVQMLGAQTSKGDTNGRCGSSVATSSTKCMDEIVMFHEDNVHVPACERDRAAGRTTPIGSRAPLSTVDYIREERAGYQAEITRIREVLRLLPDSCRPDGWVGMINYFEEKTMTAETTVKSADATSTQKTEVSLKRQARILYREAGPWTGNVGVKEVITRSEVASGRTSCTGGLRPTPADRVSTGTLVETTDVDDRGIGETTVDFSFDPQTGEFSLWFEVPGLLANGTATRMETTTGACNPADNGSRTGSGAFSTMYDSSPVGISGVATPGLDSIRGQQVLELAPPVSIPNVSLSHQAGVSWVFYRVN